MTNFEFNSYKLRKFGRVGGAGDQEPVDIINGTIKWRLEAGSSSVATDFDPDTMADFLGDEEFTGGGYTTGGDTLTTKAISDGATGAPGDAKFTADNVTYTSLDSGGNDPIIGAILYDATNGTPSTNFPIGWYDDGGFNFSAPDAPVDFIFPGTGLFRNT